MGTVNKTVSHFFVIGGLVLIVIGFAYSIASVYCVFDKLLSSICGIENSYVVLWASVLGVCMLAPGLVMKLGGKKVYLGYLLVFVLGFCLYSINLYG